MRWWRRLRDWLEAFDEYEWPDGVAWPEGTPTQRMKWLVPVSTVGSFLIIAGILGVNAAGVPFVLAMGAGMVLVFLPWSLLLVWVNVREAKRQGWGSNMP